MSSFVKRAGKQVADIRAFLRDAAGGNSIKYNPEKGAKHVVYFPFKTVKVIDEATGEEAAVKRIEAISGNFHEWTTADGKFKSVSCLKGIVENAEDGTVLNDGSCPFCDRIADAWGIYNYRKEKEELSCRLQGDQRENHLKITFNSFRDERKAKETRSYMYILVVKFRTKENNEPVIGADGLPEYELKVMKMSSSKVEKIQKQVVNAGVDLPGSEIIFEYPNVEDKRLLSSQATTTLVFTQKMLTSLYPALLNKINEDVEKFEWDGIEKAFPEWQSMTTAEALKIMDNAFEQWDKYQKELIVNPQAKYLEYVIETPTVNPSLGGAEMPAPVIPTAAPTPVMPTGGVVIPTADVPVMPGGGAGVAPTGMPMPTMDPNAVFNAAPPVAPIIP